MTRNWPDCTPEQEQALNKIIDAFMYSVKLPEGHFISDGVEYRRYSDGRIGYERFTPLPGEVAQEWAGIDKDLAELERIYAL